MFVLFLHYYNKCWFWEVEMWVVAIRRLHWNCGSGFNLLPLIWGWGGFWFEGRRQTSGEITLVIIIVNLSFHHFQPLLRHNSYQHLFKIHKIHQYPQNETSMRTPWELPRSKMSRLFWQADMYWAPLLDHMHPYYEDHHHLDLRVAALWGDVNSRSLHTVHIYCWNKRVFLENS